MSGPIGPSGERERADSIGEWCSKGGGGGMRVFGMVSDGLARASRPRSTMSDCCLLEVLAHNGILDPERDSYGSAISSFLREQKTSSFKMYEGWNGETQRADESRHWDRHK